MSVRAAIPMPVKDVLSGLELRLLNKAMHELVHKYPQGAANLAPKINKSATSLCHEVNPNSETHKLGLLDAVRLLKLTDTSMLLQNICQVLGYTLVPVRKFEGCSDIEVLTMYAQWHKELGDVSQEVSAAFADGKLTAKEYSKILKEGLEAGAAFHSFLSRLEAIMDDE
jgi:regulatory protein CII